MVRDNQDELARAFAMLSSLRKNIDQITSGVTETYVREFHTVLDRLEGIEIDVSEFRIPDSAVKPRITSSWFNGERSRYNYSDEKYVERLLMLTKLDAILGYFEIITSEKPRKIGFSK